MLKRAALSLVLVFVTLVSCRKVEELKDRILAGYWRDIDGLTVNIRGTQGYVVDFGSSHLGKNKLIFNQNMPYIKNLTRINHESWEADIAISQFDEQHQWSGVKYEKTYILMASDSSLREVITFSHANPNSTQMFRMPESYSPPGGTGNPVACDTVSVLTTSGNVADLKQYWRGDQTFTNIPVRSKLYKPLNSFPSTPCHYEMRGTAVVGGNLIPVVLFFSEKPTGNQVYTLDTSQYASINELTPGTAGISFEYYWYPGVSAPVNVTVSGGKITATVSNVELHSSQSTWNQQATYISLSFQGE